MSEPVDPIKIARVALHEWARWRMSAHGYPTGHGGCAGGAPASRPPLGVEIPRCAAHVARALEHGAQAGLADSVGVLHAVYLRRCPLADVWKSLGVSEAVGAKRRRAGEMFVYGWMSASGFDTGV